jgi:hypothetical protein
MAGDAAQELNMIGRMQYLMLGRAETVVVMRIARTRIVVHMIRRQLDDLRMHQFMGKIAFRVTQNTHVRQKNDEQNESERFVELEHGQDNTTKNEMPEHLRQADTALRPINPGHVPLRGDFPTFIIMLPCAA